jgi:cell division septation protein DedD
MAREGNVGWRQPAGNNGPQINVTVRGGGIDFVGRVTPGVNPIPDEATLTYFTNTGTTTSSTEAAFYTTIDGVASYRYRVYGQLPPSPPPTPGPTPPPPPYTPPLSAPQRLKVIRCNGTGGYKHLSVSPFGNYSNGMAIRFGSPYASGYCYTIVDQDTTGSLVDGTSISVISAYLTCTSCNSSLPALSGTTAKACLDNGGQNGRITVTPSGGTGVYYFKLNGAGSYGIAGAAATNADGLADGAYTVTLYDDGGNSAALTGQTLACYIAPSGTVTKSCTSTNNAGGKITVTSPAGGTGAGYYFTLNGAGSYSTGATGATGLADGSYIVRLYDSIGNVSVLSTETIACYEAPTGTAGFTCIDYTATNARIDVTSVAGGTGTGYYFTLNGAGSYTVGAGNGPASLSNGTYAVVLYDSYGSRSLGNVVVDCANCTISGGTASTIPPPAAPTPTPAAPTPTPAAPTPTPAAPTPTPEAPTPTPAAPPPVSSLDWDCILSTCTNVGTGAGIYTSYEECIAYGCEGTPPAAPTPAAPTPAAPTPTATLLNAVDYGFHGADPDTACTSYEIVDFVTKYNQANSPSANGISIYNNSDGTGTPIDGYYARGGNVWYSTGGVLGSEAVCYAPTPTPAAPTPTPAAPTPTPAAPTPTPAAPTPTPTPAVVDVYVQNGSMDVPISDVTINGISVYGVSGDFPVTASENVDFASTQIGLVDIVVYYNGHTPGQNIIIVDSESNSTCCNLNGSSGMCTFVSATTNTTTPVYITVSDGSCF